MRTSAGNYSHDSLRIAEWVGLKSLGRSEKDGKFLHAGAKLKPKLKKNDGSTIPKSIHEMSKHTFYRASLRSDFKREPALGFEPTTC